MVNQTNQNSNKSLWLGIGIGFAIGGITVGTTATLVTRNMERSRARQEVSKARRYAYASGKEDGFRAGVEDAIANKEPAVKVIYDKAYDDALLEAQEWIEKNMIQVDSADPEAIQKAIESRSNSEGVHKTGQANSQAVSEPNSDGSKEEKSEESGKNEDPEVKELFSKGDLPGYYSGMKYFIQLSDGTTMDYPIELFRDANGGFDPAKIRENLRNYEHNVTKLSRIWEALGWGSYIPDPDGLPTADDIDNWDISIDDMEKSMGDEPLEKTMERQIYMDMIENYKKNPLEGIRYITRQEYENEATLDVISIDYYDVDNVFLQPLDNDRKLEDPITDLGVSDGKMLFDRRISDDEDPDVVYIQNFRQNFVAEITRYHKSSTGLMDGSAYLNGSTGIVGGAERV